MFSCSHHFNYTTILTFLSNHSASALKGGVCVSSVGNSFFSSTNISLLRETELKMAKRISASSVNWTYLSSRLQGKDFLTFKGKTDKFVRMVLSNPAELPKIDWAYYKNNIATAGLVDSFQKSYETVKIPYPSDQGWLSKVDENEVFCFKKADDIMAQASQKIAELTAKLKELESHIPYSQMSVEEFMIARPEFRFDPNKPRLWPQFIDTHLPDNPPHKPSDH